ncbi:unnamed protein product, partial [Linum tenue]
MASLLTSPSTKQYLASSSLFQHCNQSRCAYKTTNLSFSSSSISLPQPQQGFANSPTLTTVGRSRRHSSSFLEAPEAVRHLVGSLNRTEG